MSSVGIGATSEESILPPGRGVVHWRIHIGFAVAAVCFFALYAGSFWSLVSIWLHDGTFQYAFLIVPVCIALVWSRRAALRRVTPAPRVSGLVLVAGLCAFWLAGALANVDLVRQIAVVAMIPSLVFTFYGWPVVYALLFPLAYLYFTLPIGGSLVSPLQTITAHISVTVLKWTGVPVLFSGHYITTPVSTWYVANACSGIKFFIATTAIGLLYANLFYRSWPRRIVFVVAAMIVPVIANGLRVYFTILIGETFGLQYATGTDHLIFGWQFFGTVLVLLFLAGWPWHETTALDKSRHAGWSGRRYRLPGKSGVALLCAAAVVFIVLAPILMYVTAARATPAGQPVALSLPAKMAGLQQLAAGEGVDGPGTVFQHANGYAQASFGSSGRGVRVYVALYTDGPSEGHELLTFGNRVYDPGDWQARDYAVPGGPGPVRELRLESRRGNARWLIWYWYRAGEHVTTSRVKVKAWQALGRLLGGARDTAVIALATPVDANTWADARDRLRRVAVPLAGWAKHNIAGGP